jgi:DNA-binding HxlR family transcriptional regulator
MHAVQDAVVYYKDDDHWLTSKVLSQHLASLIDFELVEKTNAVTNDDAQHYRLTPKGISVMPLLIELFFWGERNY